MLTDRLIAMRDLPALTSLSRAQLYLMIARNEFPKAVAITSRRKAWLESAVNKWIAERVKAAGGE